MGMPWKESSVRDERLRFAARLLDGEAIRGLPGLRHLARSASESLPALKLRRASCYAHVEGGSLQILRSANGAKQDGAPRRVMMRTTPTP